MIKTQVARAQVMIEHDVFVDRRFHFGLAPKRLVIIGDGPLANNLARVLVGDRGRAYDIVGFLSRDAFRVGRRIVHPKVIGTIDTLYACVEQYAANAVAVCLEDPRGVMPVETLLDIKAMGVEVLDGHQLYEEECGRLSIDELKPSFLIFSPGFRRKPLVMFFKRVKDIVGALLGLILLLPLLLLVALLIKWDSPGPILYHQTRTGFHGIPFRLLKFRSMRPDAEAEGAQWATEADARVTRVGYWLRKLRLDEVPQLINVLKGEMSLVGPRPERPQFVEELRTFIPFYDLRHTVRPGLSGWAQTCFRYGASHQDSHIKLQYDLYYVKNLSIWLDLRILLNTIHVVLLGTGAR